jgi:hypothetical protein
VASATINASNQLGGSIGTSLLNTIFASTIVSAIAAHTSHGAAALDGYTTVFWWTAAIFAGGAVIATALLRSGPLATAQQGWGGASGTGEPADVDASAWREQQLPVS